MERDDPVSLLFYKRTKNSFLRPTPPAGPIGFCHKDRTACCVCGSYTTPRVRKKLKRRDHVRSRAVSVEADSHRVSSCLTPEFGVSPCSLRLILRRSASSPEKTSLQKEEDTVQLVSYKRCESSPAEFGSLNASRVMDLRNGSAISSPSGLLQEEKCYPASATTIHIPPPAGFDSPTRPSTLLAALVRGPISLDESSLSPATQRQLAYVQKHHSQSSFQIRHQHHRMTSSASSDASLRGIGARSQSIHHRKEETTSSTSSSKEDVWTSADLPTSPLSPPSPFQHPFIRRQLGLLPSDSWSKLSAFGGLPKFNPLFQINPLRKDGKESSSTEEDDDRKKPKNGSAKKIMFTSSTTRSIICYCKDTKLYKACKEAHFFSDGVSETESEDDDEDGFQTPTSGPTLNNLGGDRSPPLFEHRATKRESASNNSTPVTPGSKSLRVNSLLSNHEWPLSFMETESKRNSRAASSEADVDDISSLTTSEPDSFHDASSPYSIRRSPSVERDFQHRYSNHEPSSADERPYRYSNHEPSSDGSSFHYSNHEPILDKEDEDSVLLKDKALKIAREILFTERSYVKVLHLIDQEFQFRVDQENRAHHLFPSDQMPQIFSNIKSIFKLHHDFLLPQLEERMSNWDSFSKIGDIMKSFAPFLKMYTDYIRNFDNAMTVIAFWQSKCPKFAAIMDEIHQLDTCGNLSLQHHMLSPVQRIPRYEMLLKDYLKHLPEDSLDKEDTEKALHLVSTAANHANDAMKKIDKFQKLLEVQESLGGAIDLVSPTRELLKEGRIIKISARSGDHQDRYLFLLTDLLLLCTARLIGGRVISGPQYRLRARYNVETLDVLEGDNLETANTFYIRDSNKTVELYTTTRKEKEAWLEALFQAISETYKRKSSLKLAAHSDPRPPDPDLGLKQPTLIRTDSVSKCMQCACQFSVVRRKHHCRACGFVFCNKCLNNRTQLPYDSGKSSRVCRTCYECLHEFSSGSVGGGGSPDSEKRSTGGEDERLNDFEDRRITEFSLNSRGVLEVSASASGAWMQGFLLLKTHRKAWVRRWFALHSDFVLYSFKTENDEQALTATPVPGFTIAHLQNCKNDSGVNEKDRDKAFRMDHSKKQYLFQTSCKEDAVRWINALQKASKAEAPINTTCQ